MVASAVSSCFLRLRQEVSLDGNELIYDLIAGAGHLVRYQMGNDIDKVYAMNRKKMRNS